MQVRALSQYYCSIKRFGGFLHMRCPTAANFARQKIQPLVKEMDENSHMDASVIQGLFKQGVCCVEYMHM